MLLFGTSKSSRCFWVANDRTINKTLFFGETFINVMVAVLIHVFFAFFKPKCSSTFFWGFCIIRRRDVFYFVWHAQPGNFDIFELLIQFCKRKINTKLLALYFPLAKNNSAISRYCVIFQTMATWSSSETTSMPTANPSTIPHPTV